MVPSTAASVALLATAAIAAQSGERYTRKFAVGATIIVCAVAVTTLAGSIASVDDLSPHTGRMSLTSSGALLALSLSLILSLQTGKITAAIHAGLTTIVALLSGVIIAGYLFDAPALYELFILSATSLKTGISLALLSFSILLLRSTENWTASLFQTTQASRAALWAMPAVIAVPILLVWLLNVTPAGEFIPPSLKVPVLAIVLSVLAVTITILVTRNRSFQELEARRTITLFEAILNGIEVGAFVFDAQGNLVTHNAKIAEFVGQGDDAMTWLSTTRFFTPETRSVLEERDRPYEHLVLDRSDTTLHVAYLAADGSERVLMFACKQTGAVAQLDTSGITSLTVLTVRDQTQTWRLRQSLSEMERHDAIAVVAGGVAHEMGNFLGAIRLSADTAALQNPSEQLKAQLDVIAHACERGVELSAKLLDLTRNERMSSTPVDIARVLATLPAMARAAGYPPEFALEIHPVDAHLIALTAHGELEAALINLILNAGHALAESGAAEGKVSITAYARDHDTIDIVCEDNGPGISAEMLGRVCEPFFTTRAHTGGTGLGLAMVDRFAAQSKGKFSIASRVDVGTTATLSLSRGDHDHIPALPDEADSLDGAVIVVIETNEELCSLLPEVLKLRGARPHVLSNVTEIASLDPGILDACAAVVISSHLCEGHDQRVHSALPNAAILLLARSHAFDAACARGAALVLQKPVSVKAIVQSLSMLLTGKS